MRKRNAASSVRRFPTDGPLGSKLFGRPQVLLELVECRIFNRQELESVQITQSLHVVVELAFEMLE